MPVKIPAFEKIEHRRLDEIRPNPLNPRKKFEGPDFDQFCENIARVGVLQPILVRPIAGSNIEPISCIACEFRKSKINKKKGILIPGEFGKCVRPEGFCEQAAAGQIKYEIVFGGRRYAACVKNADKNGGMKNAVIPAQVRELSDDDALDLMTVENLQREDLTPWEEARGFKIYVDRFGEEKIPDLAERVNMDPRYIRRRLALLKLPEAVLEAWDKGNIQTGHLHQLLRLEDKSEIAEFLKDIVKYERSVGDIKHEIDRKSPPLKWAKFDLTHAGCPACNRNSDVQKKLFDIDCEAAKCLYPKCFKQNQNNYFLKNWKKTGFYKRHHTTGFRFFDDISYEKRNDFYKTAPKKCHGCINFVTLLDLEGTANYQQQTCIGKKDCYEAARKSPAEKKTGKAAAEKADPTGPRVSWHGTYFREKFFQSELPQRIEQLTAKETLPDVDISVETAEMKADRLTMLNLIQPNRELATWFALRHNLVDKKKVDSYGVYLDPEQIFAVLLKIEDPLQLRREIRAASAQGILTHQFFESTRRLVAAHIGIDLAKEFAITEEYLQKKTKAEMLAMGEQLGIFADEKVQTYLFETLGKKRGKFSSCKAGELRDAFLKSGVELKGKVPDEILANSAGGNMEQAEDEAGEPVDAIECPECGASLPGYASECDKCGATFS